MATRTSSRSTKAVKFVDPAESDNNDEADPPTPVKVEETKPRVRSTNIRRKRTNDDQDWDAQNEQVEDDDDEVDDDADEMLEADASETERDVTKKFKANRSMDSVYDFGWVNDRLHGLSRAFACSRDASRKWTKSTTPQRTNAVPKTTTNDSGKSAEKLMCSYW